MTVAKGQPWGELGPLPDDGVVVHDDVSAASVLADARGRGVDPPAIGLLGGDLCRTVGGRGDEARLHRPDAARLRVDLLVVRLDDGDERVALAHVVLRGRSWLHGPILAAMNAAWIGAWNAAPRAHPNDGLAEVIRADPPMGDRWKARRRLPLGTHVPHPRIRITRSATATLERPRPGGVWLDGVRVGDARTVVVQVVPDAVAIVV